ncbi:hypothetical protein HW555_000552 [Spodoptera exigua]|uniref:Torso-like protein n=1 Tax=Spodoptera exigua TaxID=7107 RepID=A0A835GUP2_SPOEX|nr:hypothetical protein HW555_000552 [Spodoptera exigua]
MVCSACVMVRTHTVLLLAVALCGAATTLDSELGLGKAINIFMRYGYLSICMRVVPRNDTEGWVFREPTVSVFREVEQYTIAPTPRHAKTLFDGDFHMEFCDNLKQLLQAYFRDFSFERLERPWRAFTAGWPTDIMARNLGINSSFINGDHCYVLVRVSRFRETAKLSDLPGNIAVEDVFVFSRGVYTKIKERVKSRGITDIPISEMNNFFSPLFAEHVGAVKVFVFSRTAYSMIKERLKSKGVADITAKELEGYFSPWHAKHIGQIKVASGNKTVENWAMKRLRVHYYIFSYPSLLKLHGEPSLLRSLDTLLGNEALLQLELKTLSPAFKDPKKKKCEEDLGYSLNIGNAIDVFANYGDLSQVTQVISADYEGEESEDSIVPFSEKNIKVFANVTSKESRSDAEGVTSMELMLCETFEDLLDAYFKNFKIEGTNKPWKAFMGDWIHDEIMRTFGIEYDLKPDCCFVLVKLTKINKTVELGNLQNVAVKDYVMRAIEDLNVFKYKRRGFDLLRSYIAMRNAGRANSANLRFYFSSYFLKQVGDIRIASGNKTIETWARTNLRDGQYLYSRPSLLRLNYNAVLVHKLNNLMDNGALIGLNLKTLRPLFKDKRKADRYAEVVENDLQLWEINA